VATWADVKQLALALPEAEESTTYRKPAFKVAGKVFAWESPHEHGARSCSAATRANARC
jgi:hypothetical protein